MPVQFFEGVRSNQRAELNRKNMERRFYALAAAVQDHETRGRRARGGEEADRDEALYRKLRQLCGEPVSGEHEVA